MYCKPEWCWSQDSCSSEKLLGIWWWRWWRQAVVEMPTGGCDSLFSPFSRGLHEPLDISMRHLCPGLKLESWLDKSPALLFCVCNTRLELLYVCSWPAMVFIGPCNSICFLITEVSWEGSHSGGGPVLPLQQFIQLQLILCKSTQISKASSSSFCVAVVLAICRCHMYIGNTTQFNLVLICEIHIFRKGSGEIKIVVLLLGLGFYAE